MEFENSQMFARQADREDALRSFREAFIIPQHNGADAIYFLGNSLGLQPKRTRAYIDGVLQQWSAFGVEGFFMGEDAWMEYHQRLLPMLSKIVGAKTSELVVMNQLTVNLHLMLASFYQPQGNRKKILCEARAFPSDQYMLHSHVRQRGFVPDEIIIEVQPRSGEVLIREEDILNAIQGNKDELALVLWGGVNYYSGQVFDMKAITAAAHAAGAKVGFDLAHATGNIALSLHDWEVDFACWCSYKYLNSGPGAVGGCFIHERYHTDPSLNRFAGWWGNKKQTQFLMKKEFEPEASAEGWQLSTPSPVLFAAHRAALDIVEEAGWERILVKNRALSDYLHFLLRDLQREIAAGIFKVLTPADAEEKGCQVSMTVSNGKSVFDHLAANGVYADWREPDVIRVAPVALYNSFEEAWQFTQILKTAIHKFKA